MGIPEGKEIGDGGSVDQGFSKTEEDTKTQIKVQWIPGRKNTNKTILRPIIDLTAKNQEKENLKSCQRK